MPKSKRQINCYQVLSDHDDLVELINKINQLKQDNNSLMQDNAILSSKVLELEQICVSKEKQIVQILDEISNHLY